MGCPSTPARRAWPAALAFRAFLRLLCLTLFLSPLLELDHVLLVTVPVLGVLGFTRVRIDCDEEQVVVFSRLEGSPNGGFTWCRDGRGWQAFVHIGVVRTIGGAVLFASRPSLRRREVLDGRVHL